MLKPFSLISRARARAILNVLGAAILLVGLGTAVAIWRAQDRVDKSNPDQEVGNAMAPLAPTDSPKQSRDIEIYYGKTGLLMQRWSEKAKDLTHGKPLADLIGVVSALTATGCFLLAARLGD